MFQAVSMWPPETGREKCGSGKAGAECSSVAEG